MPQSSSRSHSVGSKALDVNDCQLLTTQECADITRDSSSATHWRHLPIPDTAMATNQWSIGANISSPPNEPIPGLHNILEQPDRCPVYCARALFIFLSSSYSWFRLNQLHYLTIDQCHVRPLYKDMKLFSVSIFIATDIVSKKK